MPRALLELLQNAGGFLTWVDVLRNYVNRSMPRAAGG